MGWTCVEGRCWLEKKAYDGVAREVEKENYNQMYFDGEKDISKRRAIKDSSDVCREREMLGISGKERGRHKYP